MSKRDIMTLLSFASRLILIIEFNSACCSLVGWFRPTSTCERVRVLKGIKQTTIINITTAQFVLIAYMQSNVCCRLTGDNIELNNI